MVKSKVLETLRSGGFVKVAGLSRVKEPWLAEVIGWCGFDVIWFDMEHRAFGYEAIEPISLACRATGIDLMVRLLKDGYTGPMRALEFGANGLMVPHIRSAAEARQWVEWTKYPPLGKRGFDGAGADSRYMLADPLEHLQQRNAETFLVLQIEDPEAVECVDEIAAVEGVDLLFVGPGDLSIAYGVPLQGGHALIQKAIDKVAEATAKAGNWWGIPTGSPEAAQAMLNRGARFITCGGDHPFLVNGFKNAAKDFSVLKV
jgi:4-hydroxy-2-oxoheptanedioate aldolase